MLETRPVISVLMTAFNGGKFLAESVQSILSSSHENLELVLVDNGSADGSVDALVSSISDRRLRVFREPANLGIPLGTNHAFAQAKGDYISVVDQDDVIHRDRFFRQIEWLMARPTEAGVGSRAQQIDEDGRVIGQEFTLHNAAEHRCFTQFSQAAIFGTYLFRRAIFEQFPRRPEFLFSSDYDFVARVADAHDLTCLPEVLFSYRIHQGQTTTRRRREQIAAECVIRMLTAQRRRGQLEEIENAKTWIACVQQDHVTVAEIYRAAINECQRQEMPLLETYHARKLLGVSRRLRDISFALRHAKNLTLFLGGPLRAFNLKPRLAEKF